MNKVSDKIFVNIFHNCLSSNLYLQQRRQSLALTKPKPKLNLEVGFRFW